jgi:hypothetical protein
MEFHDLRWTAETKWHELAHTSRDVYLAGSNRLKPRRKTQPRIEGVPQGPADERQADLASVRMPSQYHISAMLHGGISELRLVNEYERAFIILTAAHGSSDVCPAGPAVVDARKPQRSFSVLQSYALVAQDSQAELSERRGDGFAFVRP